MYMCVPVCGYVLVSKWPHSQENMVKFLGYVIQGGYEVSNVGAGNWTQVSRKGVCLVQWYSIFLSPNIAFISDSAVSKGI